MSGAKIAGNWERC